MSRGPLARKKQSNSLNVSNLFVSAHCSDEGDLSDSRVEERSAAETSVSKEYGIPEAPPPPVDRQLLDFTDVTEVFFDIETTGLRKCMC